MKQSNILRTSLVLYLVGSAIVLLGNHAYGLSLPLSRPTSNGRHAVLRMSSSAAEKRDTSTKGLLQRDRYVATNRFAVRKGQEAKFEARWANRKSRLANFDGFQYFHLMRRVELREDGTCEYQGGSDNEEAFGNYVSFTVWDSKPNFNKWRTSEAFREAHGGTSIGAFVSTMISSFKVLRNAPRPAFYDGLLVQSVKPKTVPPLTEEGWRLVENQETASVLPAECFVACNQFFVPPENAASFEQRWAQRESKLKENDGFVAFFMNRRDLSKQKGGHGSSGKVSEKEPTHVSTTIWRDRKAFDGWRTSQAFSQAHGGGSKKPAPKSNKEDAKPPKLQWSRPPEPVFYEGTLVITTPNGA